MRRVATSYDAARQLGRAFLRALVGTEVEHQQVLHDDVTSSVRGSCQTDDARPPQNPTHPDPVDVPPLAASSAGKFDGVARRRDTRRFGRGPFVLGLARDAARWREGFPFEVPAIAAVEQIDLGTPVTLLAGDNGTGKSTIIELFAEAMGFATEGGEFERLGELPAVPRDVLGGALDPKLTRAKPRAGYYLRAESFFNVAQFVDSGGEFSPDLSIYGDVPLHGQSHGESFLALAANRFGGHGLYLLDEPEAALSVTGALALLAIVARAARDGAQFVIATHSPILLACPGARVYELSDDGVAQTAYDDLEAVRFTRGFLEAPERYLRAALADE